MNVVAVRFRETQFNQGTMREYTSKEYVYLNPLEEIQVDDLVVVDTTNNGYQIAKVSRFVVDEKEKKKASNYVVDYVDTNSYEELVAKMQYMKRLENYMESRAAEYQRLAVFEVLAEKDPELSKALKEYKSLLNTTRA